MTHKPHRARFAGRASSSVLMGVWLMAAGGMHAQEVVRNSRSPRILDYAVVADRRTFGKQWVVEQAKALLAQQTPKPVLFRLTAGTSLFEVTHALGHGKPPANKSTLDVLKETGPPRGRLARVISLPGGALLSYRDENGFSEELLWGQADPTWFTVGGTKYRLVHFHLVEAPALKGRYFLDFYFVRPRPFSLSNCGQLLRRLQSLVQIEDVKVSVRTRPWWLEDSSFPDLYPFQPDLRIPSLGELLITDMSCWINSGQLTGSGNNILP